MDAAFFFDLMDFFKEPSITETFVDILLCAVPIWLAVMIGLVIGWSWRPRWTGLVFLGLRSKFRYLWTVPPGFGARRLWLAFTALSAFSVCRTIWSDFRGKREKSAAAAAAAAAASASSVSPDSTAASSEGFSHSASSTCEEREELVTENDLEHLLFLLEGKDSQMDWQCIMEKTPPNMSYQAWRYEPQTGPTVLRSRTVFEDATPDLVRDFFWDDEFRPKWDPMLGYIKILDECSSTGISISHWIKKFPFFCSDREYIIGRRIWESGKSYYCVTKGVPYPGLQKRDKPRRVELYFSGWLIRPVESRKGDGQMSACEVILVHYEDMGIPKDVAKIGVRHGMWPAVKKLHSGMRSYQNARKAADAPLSRCALMAKITTKVTLLDKNIESEESTDEGSKSRSVEGNEMRKKDNGIDWKWIVLGGAVAVVCGVRSGAIGKALLLGAGQRIARR
ncbi:StAR-related lipid transfer protein 7, mitochondrial [Linum grandiflorum]